jgi:hypothetical protein
MAIGKNEAARYIALLSRSFDRLPGGLVWPAPGAHPARMMFAGLVLLQSFVFARKRCHTPPEAAHHLSQLAPRTVQS